MDSQHDVRMATRACVTKVRLEVLRISRMRLNCGTGYRQSFRSQRTWQRIKKGFWMGPRRYRGRREAPSLTLSCLQENASSPSARPRSFLSDRSMT